MEKQKQLSEENEQLRKQLNDAEMQLEIFEIEQSTLQEKKSREEKQRAMIAQNAKQEQLYEQDREFASTLLTDIWRDSITPAHESQDNRAVTTNTMGSSIIFELQSILAGIQSSRSSLHPLLDYLIHHIRSANGNLILSILNTLIVSCPTVRDDLLPPSLLLPSPAQARWSLDGGNALTPPSLARYDGEAPCLLKDLLHTLEESLQQWESSEIATVLLVHQLLISSYALFLQGELFRPAWLLTASVFDNATLKALVLSCLDFFLAVSDEALVLSVEPEAVQALLLRLFERIRIPNINSNENNNIAEVCENSPLISQSLRLLRLLIHVLLYNSSNNPKLSLVLRNALKSSNLNNLLTLAICLYNILYDEHFVGKYDVKEEQRSTIAQLLQGTVSLIDMLVRKTSVLTIIKQEILYEQFKSCLEVIIIDSQVACGS
ncbi:hypothetical protein WA556_000272 [Blastocystis sp. ATCC 50177/Nand II]